VIEQWEVQQVSKQLESMEMSPPSEAKRYTCDLDMPRSVEHNPNLLYNPGFCQESL
jgi:hypothetical protein